MKWRKSSKSSHSGSWMKAKKLPIHFLNISRVVTQMLSEKETLQRRLFLLLNYKPRSSSEVLLCCCVNSAGGWDVRSCVSSWHAARSVTPLQTHAAIRLTFSKCSQTFLQPRCTAAFVFLLSGKLHTHWEKIRIIILVISSPAWGRQLHSSNLGVGQ